MKKLLILTLALLCAPLQAKGPTNSDISMMSYDIVLKVIPVCKEYTMTKQVNNHLVAFLAKQFKTQEEIVVATIICHAYRTGAVDNMLEEAKKRYREDGEGS